MNSRRRLMILVALLLLLVGCEVNPSSETNEGKERDDLHIYIDPENGCEYVGVGFQSGIYPRMDREGKQVCSLLKESEESQ